jgi:hypothetical protein
MNDQRFRLYFRLGATVLALSGLTNFMIVLEHHNLAESSTELEMQAAKFKEQLPLMDQAVRDLAIAGSPDPVIAGIVRKAGIVMDLPLHATLQSPAQDTASPSLSPKSNEPTAP